MSLPVELPGGPAGSPARGLAPLDAGAPAGRQSLYWAAYAAGKPGTARADHLRDVAVPMLFLQGHIAHSDSPLPEPAPRHHVHDAAGQARHREAVQRLGARRLRAMTSLSLFR